jgi:hypothetical protein
MAMLNIFYKQVTFFYQETVFVLNYISCGKPKPPV